MTIRPTKTLIVRATPCDGGDELPPQARSTTVCSPSVGILQGMVPNGTLLQPGTVAGQISVLGRRYDLVVPDGVRGQMRPWAAVGSSRPVVYGEALFDVSPVQSGDQIHAGEPGAEGRIESWAETSTESHELPEIDLKGKTALRATTFGTFYSRPAAADPPFVHVGLVISKGTTVGLVEVMKVFNQIVYEGPGEGTVEHVPGVDGQDVKPGSLLVVVAPA